MTMKVKALVTIVAVALLGAAAPSATLHFGLDRSVPAAGQSVESPAGITLWFTEVPQDNSISIRLVDARGGLVPSSEPRQDAEDGKQFQVRPNGSLEPGGYTVAWRGIGQDGHTVRGDFGFTVVGR